MIFFKGNKFYYNRDDHSITKETEKSFYRTEDILMAQEYDFSDFKTGPNNNLYKIILKEGSKIQIESSDLTKLFFTGQL